jgi:two-component system, NtrC family, sensor histidine kinase HydH
VAQLEKMFTDLLNYSKPITLHTVLVRIDELVEQSLTQLEPLIRKMDAAVNLDLDGALPEVLVDPDKMRQVLVNVIKNALEAGDHAGVVRIAASVSGSSGERMVTLMVSDNGEGIAPQDLKRVFHPFFTTKKKGTGLGLSIVKKIMEAHGYVISVSSEEGRGTVVQLFLQCARGEERYI